MSDKLTLQIIEDLKKRRDASQPISPPTLEQSSGKTLFEQLAPSLEQEEVPSDDLEKIEDEF